MIISVSLHNSNACLSNKSFCYKISSYLIYSWLVTSVGGVLSSNTIASTGNGNMPAATSAQSISS